MAANFNIDAYPHMYYSARGAATKEGLVVADVCADGAFIQRWEDELGGLSQRPVGERVLIRWDDLKQAAEQEDRELGDVYADLYLEARARWYRHVNTVRLDVSTVITVDNKTNWPIFIARGDGFYGRYRPESETGYEGTYTAREVLTAIEENTGGEPTTAAVRRGVVPSSWPYTLRDERTIRVTTE